MRLEDHENDIVDIDKFPKTKSILIGTAVTLLLSLFQILPVVHLLVGPIIAVGFYTKTYGISVKKRVGAKMGALVVLLGSVAFFPISAEVRSVASMTDPEYVAEFKESATKTLYEQGRPEWADFIQNNIPESLSWGTIIFSLTLFLLLILLVSVPFGAIGGALGAFFFKKGPEAQ